MAEARLAAAWRPRPVKTALHQAVLDGRLHQVRLLVSKHAVNVDSKDVFGRTPLMLACLLDNEEQASKMVRIFLKAHAYPNVRDNMARTALSYACMKGREEIVDRLLREDIVDVNTPDNDGNTPLCHASLSGHPSIVSILTNMLIGFGLSVDSRNHLGYTPLLLACKYGHFASAHILLTEGNGSPTLRDNEFFLNAHDWVVRSSELHATFSQQKIYSPLPSNRFSRENTMYRMTRTPVCRHFTPPTHPLGQSLDTALRLPAIFSYFPLDKPLECHLSDGADARLALIKAIEDVLHNPRTRPVSRVTRASSVMTRSSFPATPKLLALNEPDAALMIPDIRTLFKMYSDQYEERVIRDKSLVSSRCVELVVDTREALSSTQPVTIQSLSPEDSTIPTIEIKT